MRNLYLHGQALTAAVLLLSLALPSTPSTAQSSTEPVPELAGTWVFNADASDSTDDKVEAALRKHFRELQRPVKNTPPTQLCVSV